MAFGVELGGGEFGHSVLAYAARLSYGMVV